MLFSLDVIRARKGDCLILHYGTKEDPRMVLIDGGPRAVYGPHLKPRLAEIKQARGLDNNHPLIIDLLMVSHVDDDHIQGILDFTRDLIQDNPRFARVSSFWHNSFDNILTDLPVELPAALKSPFGAAATGGDSGLTIEKADGFEDKTVVLSSLKVLASMQQGAQLRSDVINRLEAELNVDFDGGLIVADPEPIDMGDDLSFTVVGPMVAELENLRTAHRKWLIELRRENKSPEEVLSAYVDKSVPNLSSIVVLAECGGKRILLTGDARGDKILEGLEVDRLVTKGGTIEIDVLKVPHHGSSNNLDTDFFARIIADHYVFSGDGEHGNPERESLEMLLEGRKDADYTIHLTYPVDEIDKGRKSEWEKQQSTERKKGKKMRPDWSPSKQSLEALFDEHPNFGKKVSIVGSGVPHVIDLLEKVGF